MSRSSCLDSWLIRLVSTPSCALACVSMSCVAFSLSWRLCPEAVPAAIAQAHVIRAPESASINRFRPVMVSKGWRHARAPMKPRLQSR